MESLKRRFKIDDSTYHSIVRATTCNSLILNYQDVSLSAVETYLTSHPSVGRIQSLFQSESYMFGHRAVTTITAIVELTSCYSTRSTGSQNRRRTRTSVTQTPSVRSTTDIENSTQTSTSTDVSAREVRVSSELSANEDSDSSNTTSTPTSVSSLIADEVAEKIHSILEKFSKTQLLADFRRKFPKITLTNVLKINKIYIPAFSPGLRIAYFTLLRKARKLLKQKSTQTSDVRVQSEDVQAPEIVVSGFAKKMIAKMTSGEVVNTLFSYDYNTAKAIKMLPLVHQKILVYLRKHVRGTPCYFKMIRGRIELPESKVVAYFEKILRQNYPSLSLERVDQSQLCQEPYIMNDPESKKILAEKTQPTYDYCLEQ